MRTALHLMVSPLDCDPPHRVGYPEKVDALRDAFLLAGWDARHPRLVAYPCGRRLQLLSGSHRWAASLGVLAEIPVSIVSSAEVEAAWGNLSAWSLVMASGGHAPIGSSSQEEQG